MKRFFLIFIAILMLCLCACATVENPPALTESSNTLQESSEISYTEESVEVSEEIPEVSEEIDEEILALLPLLKDYESEDEENKAKEFLGFIDEYYSEEASPLADVRRHIEENGYSDEVWSLYTGNSVHVWRSLYLGEQETKRNVKLISLGNCVVVPCIRRYICKRKL